MQNGHVPTGVISVKWFDTEVALEKEVRKNFWFEKNIVFINWPKSPVVWNLLKCVNKNCEWIDHNLSFHHIKAWKRRVN